MTLREEVSPFQHDQDLLGQSALLVEHLSKHAKERILIIGPTCIGKSTLLANLRAYGVDSGATDLDEILFPIAGDSPLSEADLTLVNGPWSRSVGDRMTAIAQSLLDIQPGGPVFATVLLPADHIIWLQLDEREYAERLNQRGVNITQALAMQAWQEEHILARHHAGTQVVIFDMSTKHWRANQKILRKVRRKGNTSTQIFALEYQPNKAHDRFIAELLIRQNPKKRIIEVLAASLTNEEEHLQAAVQDLADLYYLGERNPNRVNLGTDQEVLQVLAMMAKDVAAYQHYSDPKQAKFAKTVLERLSADIARTVEDLEKGIPLHVDFVTQLVWFLQTYDFNAGITADWFPDLRAWGEASVIDLIDNHHDIFMRTFNRVYRCQQFSEINSSWTVGDLVRQNLPDRYYDPDYFYRRREKQLKLA